MLKFILILLIQHVYCGNSWSHSVYVFGQNDDKSLSPDYFMLESLYNQVSKKVVLEDGRTLTCKIPLDPNLSLKPMVQQNLTQQLKVQVQINQSQALQVFFPLNNLCAYKTTYDFLWEFCFKKYVRQFDDENTVRNLQKKMFEEFFLGYSLNYNRQTNSTNNIQIPKWNTIKLDNSINILRNEQLRINSSKQQLALIDGSMMKLINFVGKLNFDRQYEVEIQIPLDQYQNQSQDIQNLIDNISKECIKLFINKLIKQLDNNKFYMIIINVHSIVHSNLLILQQYLPFQIITHNFRIYQNQIHGPTKYRYNTKEIYIHNNLIFGSYLLSQYYFYPGMKVVGVLETKVFILTIVDVIDTSLIKFQSNHQLENEGQELIKIKLYLNLDQQNSSFICLNHPILIRENILFTQIDQNESIIIEKQDKILIFPKQKQNIDYPQQYVIENSYNRNIHILNPQHTQGLVYDSYAILVKKYQNPIDYVKNITVQQDVFFKQSNIDPYSMQQLKSHSIIIFIANSQKKLEITNEVYEYNFKKNIIKNKHHSNTYAFQFKLKGLKKMNSYEFHLKLNLNSQIFKDAEIIFFSHPKPQIICRQYGTKGFYTQMDDRYNNKTLLDKLYWVIVDIDYERVYVGQGDIIDRNNLMLEYQLSKINNDIQNEFLYNHKLIVEILAHQSYGIQLNQFESIQLKDFKVYPVPSYITKNNYTILNYSIYNLLNQQLDFDTQYIFQETYDTGTYCPAIQANRKIDILMICYQESLLKILKISEPSICSYKMKIGTNLLCDSNQKKNFSDETSIGQRMMCVLD